MSGCSGDVEVPKSYNSNNTFVCYMLIESSKVTFSQGSFCVKSCQVTSNAASLVEGGGVSMVLQNGMYNLDKRYYRCGLGNLPCSNLF